MSKPLMDLDLIDTETQPSAHRYYREDRTFIQIRFEDGNDACAVVIRLEKEQAMALARELKEVVD